MGSSQSSLAMNLNLKNKGIKSIENLKQPRFLPIFTHLEEIDLSNNKLDRFSPAVEQDIAKSPLTIEYLTVLKLSKNRFETMPDCVFTFVNLRTLDLHHNKLVSLNPKVLDLYQLEYLDVSHNEISVLPYALHRLHALKHLFMKQLRVLAFDNNPLADEYFGNEYEYIEDLGVALRRQPVPKVYLAEHKAERKYRREKMEKLSANAQILKSLLRYQEGLDALTKHMKKEYSYENLSFFLMVRAFRKKYNSRQELTGKALIKDAKLIFDTHIAADAPQQVNLPAESTLACVKVFNDSFNFPKGINQWIFDSAYKASFDLMVNDTFSRFRLTKEGKELIELIHKVDPKKGSTAANAAARKK